jgi:hypothetical protein
MIRHLPRRAVLLLAAGVLAATCAAAAACGRIGNPDPSSRRLHALAADPPSPRPVTRADSASSSIPAWDTSPDPSADTVILVRRAESCTG